MDKCYDMNCDTCAKFRRKDGCPNGIMEIGDTWDGHDGGCTRWVSKAPTSLDDWVR